MLKESPCPGCNAPLDRVRDSSFETFSIPSPGDYSICVYCASLLVFDGQLMLQLAAFPEDDDDLCDRLTLAIRALKATPAFRQRQNERRTEN